MCDTCSVSKTGFVIILCQTDDAVYRLAEDVTRFEQQETETTDKMILPCDPIFEPCGLFGYALPPYGSIGLCGA